jgi:hypothetical protein
MSSPLSANLLANDFCDSPKRVPINLARGLSIVMPGPVPGIHVFLAKKEDVYGRDKPGHDVASGSI